MSSDNREYNLPDQGETNWDELLNENFEDIDTDIQELFDMSTGNDVDEAVTTYNHVGPLHEGSYHTTASPDGGLGIVFTAADLYIDSVVVDSDLSNVSKTDLTIELREYNGGAADPPVVDSTTVTLSGGPERVDLGFQVPESSDGDSDDEYVLSRGPVPDNEEAIPLRRIDQDEWGQDAYATHTYDDIDFLRGTHTGESDDWGAENYWYYSFDWRVGDEGARLTAPWSTDIDEIYMRPRDPEEEFDNVSPRSIWFDTS